MALAALALALDSYLEVTARRDQRSDEVKARMALVADRLAYQQYEFVSAAKLLLGIVTKLAPSVDACGEDFQEIAHDSRWLRAITIADAQGNLVCSSGPLKPPVNVADRAYFKEVLATHRFVLSDYVMGRVHDEPIVLAAAPRFDYEGKIDSVIILSLDLSFLNEVAENMGGGEDTTVLLVDRSGTVVSTDRKARGLVGHNLSNDTLFKALSGQKIVDGLGPDGIRRLFTSADLADSGARVIIGFSESRLMEPVRAAAREAFGKNLLFFVAIFAIAWVLAETIIVKPIRALTHAASAFGAGRRDTRVDPDKLPRDFAELVNTFNVTADLLARNETTIVDKNRSLADANMRLGELARMDELTGLANRRLLNDRLLNVFRRSPPEPVALLVLDLDKFKPVNDLLGHPVGDLVLKEAARRLKAIARDGDLVARLGGDEFALVLTCDDSDVERARIVARDVMRAMSAPFPTQTGHVEIGGTLGIALSWRDAGDPDELLRAADLAMYRAKRDERGGFRFFEQDMLLELKERISIEAELRAGIRAGEIVAYYQPIVDLKLGTISGFEVLARWNHPSKGILPPGVFIHIAAEVGLIEALTRHLLGAACREARNWPEHLTLSVNLSPHQLGDPLLPTMIASVARDYDIAPERLEVEITEDALIQDFQAARAVLQLFRNRGIKVALDDFGTGYSSLQHLHELNFDKLKIDRSFVSDIATNPESRKFVSAIITLARGLNLPVIAEGVEDTITGRTLLELGCTHGQGYAYGRPMPANEALALLRDCAGNFRFRVA